MMISFITSFPQIVERACSNGSDRIKTILEHDSCLFRPIEVREVHFNNPPATQRELEEIEAKAHPTNAERFKILQHRGTFRELSTSPNPADRFLVYTPNTLPYNESAPLRNTLPYIPLVFDEDGGVSVDPLLPNEYVNPGVKSFLENLTAMQTQEILDEQDMIREKLELEFLRSELNYLGSVMEDDAIELPENAREMMEEFSRDFKIPLPSGLPPRSLKEIYQLPHKGKGETEGEGSSSSSSNNNKKGKKDAEVYVCDDGGEWW